MKWVLIALSFLVFSLGCKSSGKVIAPNQTSPKESFPSAELERLIKGVPSDAKLVASVALPATFNRLVTEFFRPMDPVLAAEMSEALDAHLGKHEMHDARPVHVAIGYAKSFKETSGALMISSVDGRFLKQKEGSIEKNLVWKMADDVLIMGDPQNVERSSALLKANKAASGKMVDALMSIMDNAYFAIVSERSILPTAGAPAMVSGVDYGMFRLERMRMTAQLHGDESSLGQINALIAVGLSKIIHELEMERQKTVSEPIEGLAAIAALFQGKDFVREVKPIHEGKTLTMTLELSETAFVVVPRGDRHRGSCWVFRHS